MISEEDLKINEESAALVLANTKKFTAQVYDAARAVKELCESVRALRAQLKDCQNVRDSWCSAYTELRDSPQAPSN